jgi:hypothetical protein
MPQPHPAHWTPDEFSQPEADYTGSANVDRTRKRSGKPSKAAKAAQMRRWRAKHRSHHRDYMRRYMADRRRQSKLAQHSAAEP